MQGLGAVNELLASHTQAIHTLAIERVTEAESSEPVGELAADADASESTQPTECAVDASEAVSEAEPAAEPTAEPTAEPAAELEAEPAAEPVVGVSATDRVIDSATAKSAAITVSPTEPASVSRCSVGDSASTIDQPEIPRRTTQQYVCGRRAARSEERQTICMSPACGCS